MNRRNREWLRLLVGCSCALGLSVGLSAPEVSESAPRTGSLVEIGRFGSPVSGKDFIGVEWDNPRDVTTVGVVFPEGATVNPKPLRLEWWGSVWPNNGAGGWMQLDDPWNGQWVRVAANADPNKSAPTFMFTFPPLTRQEWKAARDPAQYPDKKAPTFRRTLKVRVVAEKGSLPRGCGIMVFGKSHWAEASFDVQMHFNQNGESAGRIEIVNGDLLTATGPALDSLPTARHVTWQTRALAGRSSTIRILLRYTESDDMNSNDLTRVTVRAGKEENATGFSFVPQDVLKEGAIRLPDFGMLVSDVARKLTLANDPGRSNPHWDHTVRQRIAERPEASYASAMAGMPRLSPPQWVPLGVPSARQEVVVGPLGDWSLWRASLHTAARDSARIPFRGEKLDALLDTRALPAFDGKDREDLVRRLEDDKLPLFHVTWHTGAVHFHHALAATILLGDIGDDVTRRGDETVVLLSKLEVTNKSDKPETATVNLRYSHDAPLALNKDGLIVITPPDGSATSPGLTALRGQIGDGLAGWTIVKGNAKGVSSVLRWEASLKPGETRSLYFKAPYVDLLDETELKRLKEVSYEEEVPRVLDYWRKRLAGGMKIEVPEPALNHFYAANLWHNVITTDRDPQTGLYNQGVGTFRYRVFANETVMIARSMDMRGEHREAERFIEPMIYYQGNEPLTGRFSTKEGVFHSAGAYTHGKYAMNHGFTLWGIADHYLFTRDRTYLERVAPKVVQACEFLISERKATMGAADKPRSPIHGLAPACALEDVTEFQYWFATNAYFNLGMKRAAEALADIGHPEAARIAREAESFRQDIETAVREATTRAAVVRRRDGLFIPYVPSRVFQWRHLTEGWIREALYCSLHLATAEVVPPDDPLVTWMLDDLEDDIFFSWQSGFNVSDFEKTWFEHGGVTLQPCLLDTPVIYMARDEIPAALRAFWNTYALLIYPDAQCFAEWARRFGQGGGPLYKTSDESRFVMWLRQLLIWENGDELWFGRGIPRAWLEDGKTVCIERAPTYFGRASLAIRSEAKSGRIRATVAIPGRNVPKNVWLRLRHLEGKQPVRVRINGKALSGDRIIGEDIRLVPGETDASRPLEVVAEYSK